MDTFTVECVTLWMNFKMPPVFSIRKTGFLTWTYYSPNHFPSYDNWAA